MTQKEIEAIQSIEGTSGFRVIQGLIQEKLVELDSVSDLPDTNDAGQIGLAKKFAVKLLKTFLQDIKLSAPTDKETRKTYE